MNLDVEDLRVFTALARAGHYGRAAEASCLSRSGVSRAVRRLEQTVGQPLVRRNAAGMHGLTEAGERFVRHAESILQACEDAVEDARHGPFRTIHLIDAGPPGSGTGRRTVEHRRGTAVVITRVTPAPTAPRRLSTSGA
jgi:DNA-binding transcriptional LysR family regulator